MAREGICSDLPETPTPGQDRTACRADSESSGVRCPALISSIFNTHYGKPILVIGGGPSVNDDLAALPENYFSAIISSNDHGFRQHKFTVTYASNVDKTHIERSMPMREFMRAFKAPVINRHSWGDYRLPNWQLVTNSGLNAVVVAAVLGGHPIVTTGIDLWAQGNVYFHRVRSSYRSTPTKSGITNKMNDLRVWTKCAQIRALSGPVSEAFGAFDPAEKLPPAVPHPYRDTVGPAVYAIAKGDFMWAHNDPVRKGDMLAMTEAEWRKMSRGHALERYVVE